MTSALGSIPAPGLVLGGIFSLQIGAGLAKGLFDTLPPTAVVFLRLAFSAVALVAMTQQAVRAVLRRATRGDVGLAVTFGLSLATMNIAIYESFSRIPLGIAVTIEFIGPLGVAVALSRRRLDLLWVLLAAIGVVLLARGGPGGIDPVGVVFALVAAVGWATYILLGKRLGQRFPGSSGLTVASVVGAVAVAPIGLSTGGADLWQTDVLLLAAGIAVLSSVIPYSFELEALRRMPATVFGILMSLEPAAAALVGLVVLDEVLHVQEWIAVGLVVTACLGATRQPPSRAET
ncbi:EamA family transporter [Jiangella rhizosphaerae]|uniref:EamA family transporter n=1 Tax=Jiangella rhizosphaerae TaxID=2293569 RepID=A0A418KSZ5_9ACTN|nr:EamA family transporter [Jiangella rhizosphaerae]RIQ27332.1 EamA family transporter [Jiangella rhizosphaerae]